MLAIRSVEINPQSVTTGQNVIISVLVIDVSWETIKNEFQSWGDIKKQLHKLERCKESYRLRRW